MKSNQKSPSTLPQSLSLAWLYPELMSTYGDRGNIIVLQKRAAWRGIDLKVERINQFTDHKSLSTADLLFMGGAQDIQQEIVQKDLSGQKGEVIAKMIENGTPGLFICGAYQFLGKYYKDAYGNKIKGLGLFDMHTEVLPNTDRLIGNIVIKPRNLFIDHKSSITNRYLVGFENHGGRTFLGDLNDAFGEVVIGHGNNGEDKTEGIHYKNTIGTYLHGPILPSNPELADHIIEMAYESKYGEILPGLKGNDDYAKHAKLTLLKKLSIS